MQFPHRFNIRVYGLWIQNNHLLCCRENYGEREFFKFPGGGLDFGEGIIDCLYREFREETGSQPESHRLYFVNEYYQQSAFDPADQLVSLYYLVEGNNSLSMEPITEYRNEKPWLIQPEWHALETLSVEHFTFPVDKLAFEKLLAEFRS